MRSLARLTISVVAGFAFAGCGAHGALSALPGDAAFGGAERRAALDNRTGGGQELLYATDAHNVLVYSYPNGKKVNHVRRRPGVLPDADCADGNGNVYVLFDFILTSGNTWIDEYAHGGTKSIRSLFDYGDPNTSCSADPVSGDLAVTGAHTYVKIWKRGSNSGTVYQLPAGFFPYACAYDNHGNLFVDGSQTRKSEDHVSLVELPKRSGTFVRIGLPRTRIATLGWLQWDGKYLAFGNSGKKAYRVYRLAVSGMKARVAQTVHLDAAARVPSFWIQGKTIVGGGYVWNYPAGGKPIVTIGAGASGGVAVSVPPRL
jgi:hypothetical protein